MTFNEFQRELERRGIDKQNAYMFTLIYERLIEMAKQQTDCGQALLALTNTVANFVSLNEAMDGHIKKLMRGNMPDGVDVRSVRDDPNDE